MSAVSLPALAICGSNLADRGSFTVAVRTDAGMFTAASPPGARIDLALLVRAACERANTALRTVREVRVDRGPGSYIGLRIALTYARVVASFTGAPLLATESLMLLAASTLDGAPELLGRRLWTLLDGRQERLQSAAYRGSEDRTVAEQTAPAAVSREQLISALAPADVVLAPRELLAVLDLPSHVQAREPLWATAEHLFSARLTLRSVTADDLEPLYLMGSYAG